MNSSSRENFTKNKASEARETLGRLIEAKKAYDNPRSILRRGSVNAAIEQEEKKSEDRIDRLEKVLLNAIEKFNPNQPSGTEKSPGPEERQLQLYHGPPSEEEYHTQANSIASWNPDGSWNQGRQKDAPWRNHPNFRWSDNNQSQPPPLQITN